MAVPLEYPAGQGFVVPLAEVAADFRVGKNDVYAELTRRYINGVDYVDVAPRASGHAGVYVTFDCVTRMIQRTLDALAGIKKRAEYVQ
jgi:hypothetical protein